MGSNFQFERYELTKKLCGKWAMEGATYINLLWLGDTLNLLKSFKALN